jgi:hypothetical protein
LEKKSNFHESKEKITPMREHCAGRKNSQTAPRMAEHPRGPGVVGGPVQRADQDFHPTENMGCLRQGNR